MLMLAFSESVRVAVRMRAVLVLDLNGAAGKSRALSHECFSAGVIRHRDFAVVGLNCAVLQHGDGDVVWHKIQRLTI